MHAHRLHIRAAGLVCAVVGGDSHRSWWICVVGRLLIFFGCLSAGYRLDGAHLCAITGPWPLIGCDAAGESVGGLVEESYEVGVAVMAGRRGAAGRVALAGMLRWASLLRGPVRGRRRGAG